MSKSFLESYTDTPWIRARYAGFDPDLHKSGLACIEVTKKNSTGQVELHRVELRSIDVHIKYKQLQAVHEMIRRIHEAIRELPSVDSFVIESQQLYPNNTRRSLVAKGNDDTRQCLVAKGNDLIMLATISGAVAGAYQNPQVISIKLPASWKAQKKKEPMHARAARIVEMSGAVSILNGKPISDVSASGSHCMDALCMALTQAGYRI